MSFLSLIRPLFFSIFLLVFSSACNSKNVYISMTTSPERLRYLGKVLNPIKPFILSEDVKKVYINISKRGYRNRVEYPKETLKKLQDKYNSPSSNSSGFDGKVEFNWVDSDLGPITKILPAKHTICSQKDRYGKSLCNPKAQSKSDPLVISIDDDYQYNPQALSNLVKLMNENSDYSISAYAYKTGEITRWGIPITKGGLKFPIVQNSAQVVEGWGTIIYRIQDLDDELMRVLSQVSLECRLSDDLVISYSMAIGEKVRKNAPLLRLKDGMYEAITDIESLSGGSGLENWFNRENWDQFLTHIRTATEYGGITSRRQLRGSHTVISAIKSSDAVPNPSQPTEFKYLESDRLSGEVFVKPAEGDFIQVYGHRKVGFIGRDAFDQMIGQIESQREELTDVPQSLSSSSSSAADSLTTPAAASPAVSEVEEYRNKFQDLLQKSNLKIDGFKYQKCLKTLNHCTLNKQGKLKSREQILIDCLPQSQPMKASAPQSLATLEIEEKNDLEAEDLSERSRQVTPIIDFPGLDALLSDPDSEFELIKASSQDESHVLEAQESEQALGSTSVHGGTP